VTTSILDVISQPKKKELTNISLKLEIKQLMLMVKLMIQTVKLPEKVSIKIEELNK